MGAFRDRLRALATALWPFHGDDAHLWVEPGNAITRKVTASLQHQQFPALPAPPVHPQIAREEVVATKPIAVTAAAAVSVPPASELDRAVAAAAVAAARVAKAPATTRREAPVPTRTARRRSRRAA
jgi:hypothetical protein